MRRDRLLQQFLRMFYILFYFFTKVKIYDFVIYF